MTSSFRWKSVASAWPSLLGVLLMLTFGVGCAASQVDRPRAQMAGGATDQAPRGPDQAREEIRILEQDIARARLALGLNAASPRAESPRSPGTAGVAAAAGKREQTAESRAAPPAARQAYSRDAPAGAPPPSPPAGDSESVCAKHVSPEDAACPVPCRHTRAICRAAARICELADFLGDPDARGTCQRAKSDCDGARVATAAARCDRC